MNTSKKRIAIGLCALGALGIGVYAYTHRVSSTPHVTTATSAPGTSIASSTASAAYGTLGTSTKNSKPATSVPVTLRMGGAQKTPSLQKPLLFSSSISAEVKTALQTQFDGVVAKLVKNPNQMDLWLSLGTLRKIAGDYAGAIEDWNFVAADRDSVSYIAYGNLADLYSNFVKDYPKAEASYLAAINLEPAYVDFYRGLFTLYSNVYKKGTSAAEDVLKQGIAASPKTVDLQVLLARYYVSLGRTADAKLEYDVAIANAKSQGLTELTTQLQAEKAGL